VRDQLNAVLPLVRLLWDTGQGLAAASVAAKPLSLHLLAFQPLLGSGFA
jgi:hypothetical protein